jgi:hypothetical protein
MSPLFDENGNEVSVEDVIKSEGIRDQLKEANAVKAKLAESEAKLAQVETARAFDRLGIPETGQGELVRKLIDGEPTKEKVDAIVSQYGLNLGGTQDTQTTPVQSAPTVDPNLEQLRQLQGAVGSSAGQSVDPVADAYARMAKAQSQEEVMEIVREVAEKGIIPGVVYGGQVQ